MEYTKVSSSLISSLNKALDNYQSGNYDMVEKISTKYNNSSYRSQPRQVGASNKNSSRYDFTSDFWILEKDKETESDITGTQRSKSAYNKSTERERREEVPLDIHKLKNPNHKSVERFPTHSRINFRQSNFLFKSKDCHSKK